MQLEITSKERVVSPHFTRTAISNDERFEKAIAFFREKNRVLFVSYCRFWESHPFVQQSLARLLVDHGIEVEWLDGQGWRSYRPVQSFKSSRLRIGQLWELPGRRF